MDIMTIEDILEQLDTIIEYLSEHSKCGSALYIANQLRDEIDDMLYDD
jgi:hypothetical protein